MMVVSSECLPIINAGIFAGLLGILLLQSFTVRKNNRIQMNIKYIREHWSKN